MGADVALVIPAAGEGRRMGHSTRKPFLEIGGGPILHLTLERFREVEGISCTVLAINPADFERRDEILAETRKLGVTHVVKGGGTRTESVSNALGSLPEGVKVVLIHDAVRPFVARAVIDGVMEAARRTGAAIAAVRVKDTIKRVSDGMIAGTVPREGLYLAQTPQGFRREVIEAAYRERGEETFTDDASLVEKMGGTVEIVESTALNFKITTGADLELARAVFEAHNAGLLHF